MAGHFNHGFTRRRVVPAGLEARLPPGQHYEEGFPVLTVGPTPDVSLETWHFSVDGLVEKPQRWSWEEIQVLPGSVFDGDIHCVTSWSKLATTFAGVSVDELLRIAGPLSTATDVVAFSYGGYTTNLRLEDLTNGKAWVVWEHEGARLPRDHGGPARLLVPHLYFWKSAKWIEGLRLLDHQERGFWELNGYHDRGDPWQEQRYQGD
jgi:DMSO/TMAO reductase YedYZ molybdopterin-dependent catalytic subunit